MRDLGRGVSVGCVSYGADGTGDVTRVANVLHFTQQLHRKLHRFQLHERSMLVGGNTYADRRVINNCCSDNATGSHARGMTGGCACNGECSHCEERAVPLCPHACTSGAAVVTGDGGVESAADWCSQEAVHARLAFYQSLAALKALVGGREREAEGRGSE